MDIEKLTVLFAERVSQWEQSQQQQTSGYEYEKSYVEMMKKLEQEVFEHLTRTKEKRKKNF